LHFGENAVRMIMATQVLPKGVCAQGAPERPYFGWRPFHSESSISPAISIFTNREPGAA
jgi:hypothetical protein